MAAAANARCLQTTELVMQLAKTLLRDAGAPFHHSFALPLQRLPKLDSHKLVPVGICCKLGNYLKFIISYRKLILWRHHERP